MMRTKQLPRFFFFFYLITTPFLAQSQRPGGVPGAQVWFHTVRISDGVFGWEDQSGYNTVLEHYNDDDDDRDEKTGFDGNRNTNFYKTLFFDEEADFTFTHSNFPQATIIAPYDFSYQYSKHKKADKENEEYLLFSLNARKGDGYVLTNDKVVHSDESDRGDFDYGLEEGRDLRNQPDDGEDDLTFRETNMRIAGYYRTAKPNNSIWGEPQVTNIFFGSEYLADNPNNTGTIDFPVPAHRSKDATPTGYIPEFIMYKRVLTPFERLKVESYLAMKYALTLDYSLLNSEGSLVWDIDREPDYNHRIAGYIRDDSSGLYQTRATTTYEERDGGLEDDHIDTYHTIDDPEHSSDLNLLRGQSSPKNLLYVAEELGNTPLENLSFTFWGDNDLAITTEDSGPITGLRLMDRRWELRTNRQVTHEAPLTWDIDNDSLTFSGTPYRFDIAFPATATATTAGAVTNIPLRGDAGFFEWKLGTIAAPAVVKFGTSSASLTPGAHDYGIYIDRHKDHYHYYAIIKGVVKQDLGKFYKHDLSLRLEKRGHRIFVLKNDAYSDNSEDLFFEIAPEDANEDFYGSVQLTKHESEPVTLTAFRHGGFISAVGGEVELSCLEGKAEEFDIEQYPDLQPYLVVDRSATGEFKADDVTLYPMTNASLERYKLIFNNIFWDEDGSGSDVFTFGYKNSNLLAFIDARDATCIDSLPATNGQVALTITQGSGSYSYRVTRDDDPAFLLSNTFTGDTLAFTNLASGAYKIVVTDMASSDNDLPDTFTRKIVIEAPDCGSPPPSAAADPAGYVYPVPSAALSQVTIKAICGPEPSVASIMLFDELGAFVEEQSSTTPSTEHTFTVSLSRSGVYLVKIITPYGEQTKKLVIE